MEHENSPHYNAGASGGQAKESAASEIYVRFTSGSLQLEMRGPETFVERWLSRCFDNLLPAEKGEQKAEPEQAAPAPPPRGRRRAGGRKRAPVAAGVVGAPSAPPAEEVAADAAAEAAPETSAKAPAAGEEPTDAVETPSPKQLCQKAGIKRAMDLIPFAVYYHTRFLGRAPSVKEVRRVLEAIGNMAAVRSASTYLSRAKTRGLVYEQNRTWYLTDAGLAEVEKRLGQTD